MDERRGTRISIVLCSASEVVVWEDCGWRFAMRFRPEQLFVHGLPFLLLRQPSYL